MEELIRQAFLHIDVIGPHVNDGHYDLVGPNGDIILPQVWESVIEPDWTITMHMWPIPERPKEPYLPEDGLPADESGYSDRTAPTVHTADIHSESDNVDPRVLFEMMSENRNHSTVSSRRAKERNFRALKKPGW